MKNYHIKAFSIILFVCNSLAFTFAQKPYFQQEVNYTIQVTLDDSNHYLNAFESIEYTNNSPDNLEFIYFHLWPNAYKNNKTAFAKQEIENGSDHFYYSSPDKKGFIDSVNFSINGKAAKWEYYNENIDICKLYLEKPLLPGEKITINTPFRVKIPGSFSRCGHVGQSYQITQWYPKPAVYDSYGWHPIPYLDQGEFYSEYGSFDVSVTLPKSYVVGATGELQTSSEIEWMDQLANANSDSLQTDSTDIGPALKTIRYTEKNIHDFGWFADKGYQVSKDSVQLPNSRDWVTTWALYPLKDSGLWKRANEYINDAIYNYSKWYGDYPYKNCSAVRGSIEAGGAMEYPEITVVGSAGNNLNLEEMIMHEVGHNWFYGILGFNEREYPFLDEGFNSFSEERYFNEKYRKSRKLYEVGIPEKVARFLNFDELPFTSFYEISSLLPQRFNIDQPLSIAAGEYKSINYGCIVYHKSALVYYYLLHSLGEEKFDSVMQSFYTEWKFKHPHPDDLKAAFEKASQEDLSWFFDDLIATTNRVDYKAVRLKNNKLLIRNVGDIASPVIIKGYRQDDLEYTLVEPGFKKNKWIELPAGDVTKVVVNDIEMPEFRRKNNTLKTQGLFKKVELLEIHPFQIIEKPDKTQLGIFPATGWNTQNKFMLGVLLYNPAIPLQKVEYQLVPMYAFGDNAFTGTGKITLHTFPELGFTRRIDVSLTALKFCNFDKIRSEATIFLNKQYARSPISQKVAISATTIGIEQLGKFNRYEYYNLQYALQNKNFKNAFDVFINMEVTEDNSRITSIINYSIPAQYSSKAVTLRIFGGYVFNDNYSYSLHLSANSTADYQFEEIYLDRELKDENYSILEQQYSSEKEGGFVANVPFISDEWMITARAKVKIPKIPINIYANLGTYSKSGKNVWDGENVSYVTDKYPWETGIDFYLNEILHIYFPIFVSPNINDYYTEYTENYGERIRFSLNLLSLNLFNKRDRIGE